MNMRKFLKTTLAIILIAGAGIIAYNMQKQKPCLNRLVIMWK